MKRRSRPGFTLIELLIVVAIIAILAAIAVPNFIEAQTRSKVSRVKNDIRTLATALEAYAVDSNHYPFDWAEDAMFPYYVHRVISTPIAYLTNGKLVDIFSKNIQVSTSFAVRERFRYRAFSENWLSGGLPGGPFTGLPGPNAPGMLRAQEVHGAWLLVSKGPDGILSLPTGFADGSNPPDWYWLQYDPTNGTVSRGEVMRSQKQPDASLTVYPQTVTYTPP